METLKKRQKIFKAALELITEHGFHGAPVTAIAERAGVGVGTVYRYFANKDMLIAELYQELRNKIHAELLAGYDMKKPLRERFLYLNTTLLRYFITNPLEFSYLEQYHNSPYGFVIHWEQLMKNKRERGPYHLFFEEARMQQVVRDIPLVVFFALTFGPILLMARYHTFGFASLDELLLTRVADACWNSISTGSQVIQ